MKRLLLVLAVVGIGVVPGVLLSPAESAIAAPHHVAEGVSDFEFESFTADYFLSRDVQGHSTLKTVETFVANFPSFDQNKGIIRAIPNDYDGVPQNTHVVSVVDENEAPMPYELTVFNGFTELALGTDDYVHGRTTYTITYTNENVVREFSDTNSDEFYSDTNGTGYYQSFGTVTARVHVDPALTEYLTGDIACYQGEQGSTERCEIAHTPDEAGDIFTSTVRNLGAGENLTVVVGFTRGTFVQVPAEVDSGGYPSPILDPPWWIDAGGIAIILFGVFGSAFTIVRRFIKPSESKRRGTIIPQYTVPKGINLLESADIVGRNRSAVAAQIVSFAVRGKLRILDYPVTQSGARYTLQLLDTTGLDDQELVLLTALFGGGVDSNTVGLIRSLNLFNEEALGQIQKQAGALTIGAVREVGVIDDGAARAVAAVQSGIRERVLARGFKKKRSSRAGFIIALIMFVLGFVAIGLSVVGSFFISFSGWAFGAAFVSIFFTFVSVSFAWRPPALTASGAERRDYLLGMLDYLKLAEADRFRMLQSPEGALRVRTEGLDPKNPAEKVKLYEKLLPFAVMWGVEREWAHELTLYYGETTPDWFVSRGTFNVIAFSNAMTTISRSSVVNSTPSSSSGRSSWSGSSGGSFSGGSSGGGFSGGGRGGGGGGGR